MDDWNIFVITHQHIYDWLYRGDSMFSWEKVKFINVSKTSLAIDYQKRFKIINLCELADYKPLGAHYAESEAIYNVSKNDFLLKGLTYIGFLHYDKGWKTNDGETNITERITGYLRPRNHGHISFGTFNPVWDYHQYILADETRPETFIGRGKHCYQYILDDYNAFFKTSYTLRDLLNRPTINLASSFMIDVPTFKKMMEFISHVIESGKLEIFDPQHLHKMQSHLLERYYGVFLLFEYRQFLDLNLPHHHLLKLQLSFVSALTRNRL